MKTNISWKKKSFLNQFQWCWYFFESVYGQYGANGLISLWLPPTPTPPPKINDHSEDDCSVTNWTKIFI